MNTIPNSIRNSMEYSVFISYSHTDKQFVNRLYDALREKGQNPWVDWVDVPEGRDWWKLAQTGIQSACTVVFVISPNSIKSKFCMDEIDHAIQCNKRLLPITLKPIADYGRVSPLICKINEIDEGSISFERDFTSAFKQLIEAININLNSYK
jgi:TIR domain